MKSSPIYNIVNVYGRSSNRSFGADTGFEMDVRVGTSAKNSHTLADIRVEKENLDNGLVRFTLFVDNTVVKSGILDGKEFGSIFSKVARTS